MPTYVTLMRWTDQGISNVKESPTRLEKRRAAVEEAGGRLVGFWWTQGAYDAISVIEWPDDESASVFALSTATSGSFRTDTMRAYTTEEMQRILQRLP
jgi:uncharacterized protein with GYD domain